jgi:hypothetical protein
MSVAGRKSRRQNANAHLWETASRDKDPCFVLATQR